MGIGIGNVANALAILAGGAGKGMLEVAIKNRDEYHQQMRDERVSAARKIETEEDRAFSKEMKEEDRGYQREMSREDREWDKEKFALQQAGAEKMARLTASLRPREGGPKASESERMIGKLADINARKAGRDKANDDDYLSAFKEYKTAGKADGVDKDPAQWELQKKIAEGELGREATPAEVAAKFKEEKADKLTAPQYMTMYQQKLQGLRKIPENMTKSDAELSPLAKTTLNAELDDAGIDYAGKKAVVEREGPTGQSGSLDDSGGARPASESAQESVSDVAQPGVIDAPATDTSGDEPKPGIPRGEGSQRSPFLAETEEELQWAITNGGAGSFVQFGDQLFKIPDGK